MISFKQFILEAAEPFLQAAIRMPNGKVFKHELSSEHEDISDKHNLKGYSQEDGFVNHLGRFMNRSNAMDFAKKHDLIHPDYHSYLKKFNELDSAFLKTSHSNINKDI